MIDGVKEIRNKIKDIVRQAWQMDDSERVILERPRGEETDLPFASIVTNTSRSMNGVRSVENRMAFEITGYFDYDTGLVIADEQLDRHEEVGQALLDFDWETLGGYMPQVTDCEYPDQEIDKPHYAAKVVFTLLTDTTQ